MPVLGQRILRRFHLSQTDAGAEAVGETFASKINGHTENTRVRWPLNANGFVLGNVRIVARPWDTQCQTTLLQLRFGVIPALVHDEILQSGEETDAAEASAIEEATIDVEGTQKGLHQVGLVLDPQLRLWIFAKHLLWNDQIAAHGQIVANHRLGSVADQTGSQQRQMALLVPGKVLVQVFAGQQLQNCVAQKFQPLVVAQRQKVVWNVPSGERLGQQANVLELDANALFELGKQLQARNNLDEVSIAVGVVSLQGMFC